jgi:FixJ family two-component response regulator
VAAELQISDITVKADRGKMIRKMGSNSLADLVEMAARLGLGPATTAAHAPSSH